MTKNITFLATRWVPVLDHIAYYSSASEFVLLNFYSQCGFCLLRWNSQYSSQTANYPTEAVGMYTTCILIHISECRSSRLSIPWSHIPNVSVCRLSNVLTFMVHWLLFNVNLSRIMSIKITVFSMCVSYNVYWSVRHGKVMWKWVFWFSNIISSRSTELVYGIIVRGSCQSSMTHLTFTLFVNVRLLCFGLFFQFHKQKVKYILLTQ